MGALAIHTRMLPPSLAKTALHESGPPGEKESFIERRSLEPYLNGILNGKHMLAHHGSFLHQAYSPPASSQPDSTQKAVILVCLSIGKDREKAA